MKSSEYRKFLLTQGSPLAYLAALGLMTKPLDDAAEA